MAGTFDDCQRLVKEAFADDDLRGHVRLTSANSINLGRLLPQVLYYFLAVQRTGGSRPDGRGAERNFGNLTAGLRPSGLGCGSPASWPPPTSTTRFPPTCEPACTGPGLGAHVQRDGRRRALQLRAHAGDLRRVAGRLAPRRRGVAATTREYRGDRRGPSALDYVLDPHGAIGWLAITGALEQAGPLTEGVFLATAHPAKFREVVEPAIGRSVPLPEVLAEAVTRPRHALPLAADYAALHALLRN